MFGLLGLGRVGTGWKSILPQSAKVEDLASRINAILKNAALDQQATEPDTEEGLIWTIPESVFHSVWASLQTVPRWYFAIGNGQV